MAEDKEDNTMAFVLVPMAFLTFIAALILTVVCCFQYKALELALEDINLEDSKREKKWGGGGGEFKFRHHQQRKMAHAVPPGH